MTSPMLMTNPSVGVSGAATLDRPNRSQTTGTASQSRVLEAMKSHYGVDQQVKFLHLQAEAESLLQHIQAIKRQRQSAIGDIQ